MRAVLVVTCILSMLFCTTFLGAVGFSSPSDGVAVYWELTGSNHIDLLTRSHKLAVNVTNYGSVMVSCDVSISSEYGKLALSPLSQTIVSIPPGETKTTYFTVTNLGVEEQVNDIPITVTFSETYTSEEFGRETVYATLLPTLIPEQTILEISVIEKGTGKPAVGVPMTILYPANGQGEETLKYTDTNGKITYTFVVGYAGDVALQIAETEDYFPQNKTIMVNFDSNQITLEVEPKNSENITTSSFDWAPFIVMASATLIVVLGLAFFYVRRKTKEATIP